MKNGIIKLIHHINSSYRLDDFLHIAALFHFVFIKLSCLLRGYKVVLLFRRPKGMMLGKEVAVFNMSEIKWGKYLHLGNHVTVSGLKKNGIHFGNNVSIGAFSTVNESNSHQTIEDKIVIGHNVSIGEFAYLGGAGGLEIGNECFVGHYFSCHPENHNYGDLEKVNLNQRVSRKGITIGENCSIGNKVTILDGVNIGYGSIIEEGSVVTRSFSENSIIGGVPARLIKSRKKDLQNYFNNLLSCKPI